jgi:predicted ATP-dependent protease
METDNHTFIIPLERLRARCDPASFTFQTTADLPKPTPLTGQDRAEEAVAFGLSVHDSSFNLFITGLPGSGRTVSVVNMASQMAKQMPLPDDWCYVYNFDNPYAPHALSLPAGMARPFSHEIERMIEEIRQGLHETFESESYVKSRAETLNDLEQQRVKLQEELEAFAQERHFVVRVENGEPNFVPMKKTTDELPVSEPYTREEFDALPEAEKQEYHQGYEQVQEAYNSVLARVRVLSLQARELTRKLDSTVAQEMLAPIFERMTSRYIDHLDVTAYLEQLQQDIISKPLRLLEEEESGAEGSSSDLPEHMVNHIPTRYRVNVIVDRTGQEHAPCIVETNPTYYNLMGRLEYGTRMGNLFTDFTFLKGGALHQANGGFLVLDVREVMSATKSWESLKRAIRTSQLTIENITEPQQSALATSLKPEPIPLSVKIIIIGELPIWDTLNENDPDFGELFKVRADFDIQMPRNARTEYFYALFLGDIAREKLLPPLDPSGVARIVEEGSRMVDDQTKLSTSLSSLRDLVIEAGHWANQSNSSEISAAHVEQATKMRRRRASMLVDHYMERVRLGEYIFSTSGAVVGQINALATRPILGQEFPRVLRVTARTSPGLEGVVNIEHEVAFSGPVHLKGVLTLAGYLAGQFSQHHPLSLRATIGIEQLYNPVEGDSASMAELCALISALSGLPIRQDLAITGSVNQFGEAQGIGGATMKVEGFFDLCEVQGFTGTQGVIIPSVNARTLMLRLDVLEAIRKGIFTIYSMSSVDDAVRLLLGLPIGEPGPDGAYPPESVGALISQRLYDYARRVQEFRLG